MDNKLLEDNLQFLFDYIPKLITGIEQIIFEIEQEDFQNIDTFIPLVSDGMEWTARSISSLERIKVIEDIKLMELNGILSELDKGLTIKDYVMVSGIFQYEIIPILTTWLDKVQLVLEEKIH